MTRNDVLKKIENLKIEKRAFINGHFVNSYNNKTFAKELSSVQFGLAGITCCQVEDIDIAVQAARTSYKSKIWRDCHLQQKKEVILEIARMMEQHIEELALLDTFETGRCFKNFYEDSIPKAIQVIRWFAEASDKHYDKAIPYNQNVISNIVKTPIGVVACITPWNDPLVPAMWKIIPALLMGNSVIVKPAEQSTLSILKFAEFAHKSGIPPGVLNVLPGFGEEIGSKIAQHMDIDAVFFTGSSEVGKLILQYSGVSNMKKVSLECGGKSPFIVTKNCHDIKVSAQVLAKNIFYNQGQICSAPSRLIIDRSIKSKFFEYLLDEYKKYIPRDPLDPLTDVGCLISKEQKNRVEKYINIGLEAKLTYFQAPTASNAPPTNICVSPIIFDEVDVNSPLFSDEIFGPVLISNSFIEIAEAIELANNSKYELAAAIWSSNLDEAHFLSRNVNAGLLHINSYGEDDMTVPFGGNKMSGIGREKSLLAFDEYSNLKTIWLSLKSGILE